MRAPGFPALLAVLTSTFPCGIASAQDRPRDVLFHCDFDSAAWLKDWGLTKAPERVELVSADPERKFEPLRGKALRVRIDRGGHYGLSLEFPFKKRLGYEPEEAYSPATSIGLKSAVALSTQ